MSTESPTEFDVNGLVIFDLNDLPEVTATDDAFTAGNTSIPRSGASLSYDELRTKSQELYAIALAVRDAHTSPELERIMGIILENTDHNREEARKIALGMVQSGVTVES